jgi:predicted nucleic acid-binding protein
MTEAGAKAFFVDTNLLLYTVDTANEEKRLAAARWASRLWEHGAGRLSWQVLNEFYYNATGRLKAPKPAARKTVETLARWQPVGFGMGVIERAWYWADRAGVPYWDGLILASAEVAGCSWLLSEDFQEGRKFGELTVLNPFRARPEEFGLA